MLSLIPAREYALVLATAALVTYLVTGLVRVLARRVGAVTEIRDRDVHQLPTPRMGGVAVYAGVAAGVLVAVELPKLSQAFSTSSEVFGVLAAGGLICLVGVLDDRFDLDAITKLAGQVLAAGVLVMFGVQWVTVWLPLDNGGSLVSLGQAQGLVITVLITVVLTNAMNFIDGLDGLLAGVALISAVGVFVFSAHQLALSHDDTGASQPPLIAAALIGACLGFLPHNFYPARIFMGDSGSMFIGLTMAAAIVSSGGKLDSSTFGPRNTIAALSPLIVVLAVVFIPLLDFFMAVVRRTREGRHPFSADKQHLHHRMLNIGHSHRQAVLIFYLWAAVLTGSAVSLSFLPWTVAIGPAIALIVLAVVVSAWPRVRDRRLVRARAGSGSGQARHEPAGDQAAGSTAP
ncbi:glycosyltransferase family 4 protein [Nakamurella lactea]|uniref:glycosyltransferase family 4 protein n=1 Tax=Nakamurella lactea TaxID=459515 RepID=UPI00068849F5|nr:MraY family glycosyltransferase [Nakamurella lactea]